MGCVGVEVGYNLFIYNIQIYVFVYNELTASGKKVRSISMLNTPNEALFFENCLAECGLTGQNFSRLSLASIIADPAQAQALKRTLHDVRTGADAVLARGKPAEDTLGFSPREWEYRWSAWAASRKAAFYARAGLLLLGESENLPYFLNTLKTSHNIVFLCAASDLLQFATGHFLNGPEEELNGPDLAKWWSQNFEAGKIALNQ